MTNNRHNFTAKTIDILAKRVGYLCSNPDCIKHTIGPHQQPDKATSIGVAAHITAASPGGARYDDNISEIERKSIENGIWLCSNCSTLIDKDPEKYPKELLIKWKKIAEGTLFKSISGIITQTKEDLRLAVLDLDLINHSKMRLNQGFSHKNKEIYGNAPIWVGSPTIIHWLLKWQYSFLIYNTSNYNAYNIQVESIDNPLNIQNLPKLNHLSPLEKIEISANFEKRIECFTEEADKELSQTIPPELIGKEYHITYTDDSRIIHKLKAVITNEGLETIIL